MVATWQPCGCHVVYYMVGGVMLCFFHPLAWWMLMWIFEIMTWKMKKMKKNIFKIENKNYKINIEFKFQIFIKIKIYKHMVIKIKLFKNK